MINRIFFIAENYSSPGDLASGDNFYHSLLVSPPVQVALKNASIFFNRSPLPIALALKLSEPLSEETVCDISSFLFLPAYLFIDDRPVINLVGEDASLLQSQAISLSSYMQSQGFREPFIDIVLSREIFGQTAALVDSYERQLRIEGISGNSLYFHPYNEAGPNQYVSSRSLLAALEEAENGLARENPLLYSLLERFGSVQEELAKERRKRIVTERELGNQKQYVEVLRSNHQAKEIQEFYAREYDILPLWYKRFGHVLKVLMGKRTFRSLFRDDVKKYKD